MWIKKLRKRKIQSVLIALIILVCSMLMTSALVIMSSWREPYQELIKECNSPSLKLYLYQEDDATIQKIIDKFKGIEEISDAQLIYYSYSRSKLFANGSSVDGFIDLVAYNEALHGRTRVLEGDSHQLKSGECFIPAVLANSENIRKGDLLEFENGLSYTVAGIYTDPYNMSVSFDTEIIVPKLPEGMQAQYYISVFSAHELSGTELIDLYRERNDKILEGRGVTIETRISNNQITEQILGAILLAMSGAILLVSGIMIRYMIRNVLISEKKTIAIYKTLGYETLHIIGIYFKAYLLLVFLGSILGIWGSKFISASFTNITYRNLGYVGGSSIRSMGSICVLTIILFVMLQVYLVLRKAKKIAPVEVFRGMKPGAARVRKSGPGTISFSPAAMAFRMIGRDRKNTIMIIITCIMTAYCVNFAVIAFSNMKSMTEQNYYWVGFDKHDVSMESADINRFDDTITKLRALDEVSRVIPNTTDVSVSIEWEKGIGDTILTSMIYESYEGLDMRVLEGRNPRYPNEIAIGNFIAEKLNKHVGDYINIYFNGNQKVTLLICGTFQSFYNMGRSCRLLGAALEEIGVGFSYTEASVYLKDGENADAFVNKYGLAFSGAAKLMNRIHKYESIMNMITGPQMMAIRPFMIISLILGGLNIVAIVYLKNKDNSKINSIYKAIGYPAGHLLLGNMLYILLIASASILVTIPLFIFLFPKTMVLAMSFMGLKEYVVVFDKSVIILGNLGTLAVFLLSGLMSSKALYDNPTNDLKYE